MVESVFGGGASTGGTDVGLIEINEWYNVCAVSVLHDTGPVFFFISWVVNRRK